MEEVERMADFLKRQRQWLNENAHKTEKNSLSIERETRIKKLLIMNFSQMKIVTVKVR